MSYATTVELLGDLVQGGSLTPKALEEIVDTLDEGQHLDYKDGLLTSRQRRKNARRMIRQYACGFANADGGVLIVGVADSPRRISPCKSFQVAALGNWVEDLLRDMAPALSPPPRIQVVDHPKGPVVVIAVSRSTQLVFTVEAGRTIYYLRINRSTIEVPEFLLTDLFLGRRQQPMLTLEIRPGASAALGSSSQRVAVKFYASLENTSLTGARNIEVGIIGWTLGAQPSRLSSYLRGHLEIESPKDDDWQLRHTPFYQSGSAAGGVSGIDRLAPFASNKRRLVADGFVLPAVKELELLMGVYVVAEGAAPQWWQCTLALGGEKDGTYRATVVTRRVTTRPIVGVHSEAGLEHGARP